MVETEKPNFNIGLGRINGILTCLYNAADYSRSREYLEWYFELKVLRRWLMTAIVKDQSELTPEWIDLEKKFSNLRIMIHNNTVSPDELYDALDDTELLLRYFIKKAGIEDIQTDDMLEPDETWGNDD